MLLYSLKDSIFEEKLVSINFTGDEEKQLVLAFVKEAKCDLGLAKVILNRADAIYKESREEVSYINRRILSLMG